MAEKSGMKRGPLNNWPKYEEFRKFVRLIEKGHDLVLTGEEFEEACDELHQDAFREAHVIIGPPHTLDDHLMWSFISFCLINVEEAGKISVPDFIGIVTNGMNSPDWPPRPRDQNAITGCLLSGDFDQTQPIVPSKVRSSPGGNLLAMSILRLQVEAGCDTYELRFQYRLPKQLREMLDEVSYNGQMSALPDFDVSEAFA